MSNRLTAPARVVLAFKRRTIRKLKRRSPSDRLKARIYYRRNKIKLRLKRKRYLKRNNIFHHTKKLFKRSTPSWLARERIRYQSYINLNSRSLNSMYQREDTNNFTGFIATYNDGSTVKEKENFFSKKQNKNCKTNWLDIDKSKLVKLELIWKGAFCVSVSKEDHPSILPEDWYFTHTGYMDINDRKIKVLNRNIGFKQDGLLTVFSVDEVNGLVKVLTRAS